MSAKASPHFGRSARRNSRGDRRRDQFGVGTGTGGGSANGGVVASAAGVTGGGGSGAGGPGGIAKGWMRFRAVVMKPRHISAGALPPVTRRIGAASSRPIQTTVVKPPVKPANQASL